MGRVGNIDTNAPLVCTCRSSPADAAATPEFFAHPRKIPLPLGRPAVREAPVSPVRRLLRRPGVESPESVRAADSVAPPVFQARGLTKVYGAGEAAVRALRDVDLDVYAGEFLVLLGPSGSGKSTLVNILGGLDAATSGKVTFLDHDLTVDDDAALTEFRREHVGFVFQFYNLLPNLTARENVAIVTRIATRSMNPAEALALVGLGDRLDRFPSQMSGGEQQRVAIARAIAKQPDVLLCDEPTGALDVETGIVVLAALDRVNRELGTTTVVITHNAAIGAMATRVLRMRNGAITEIVANQRRVLPEALQW